MELLYWLLCIIIGGVPAWLLFRNDRKKNVPVKWLPALLRFLTFFLTAALLLAPAFPTTKTNEEKPVLLWLQDNSTSIKTSLGKDSVEYNRKAKALRESWKEHYTVVPLAFGGGLDNDSLDHYTQHSTDIAKALQQAVEQYQDRNIGGIILSSDGIVNEGMNPLFAPLGSAVPVYCIGVGDSVQPVDVSVNRIYVNKIVALNSDFEIMVDVRAEKLKDKSTALNLLHNGKSIAQSPVKIDRDRFTTSLRFEAKATEKGFQRYTVTLPKQEGELNINNNSLDFFVEVVDEETKVLILAPAPHPDIAAIRAALENVPQYKVTVVADGSLPANINTYNLVIADQVAATPAMVKALAQLPVWFILGNQTSLNDFNALQTALNITGGGNPNVALPELNPGFSFFTLPAGLPAMLDKMPPLQAPYGNYSVTAGTQTLMTQKIGSVSTNYPLWLFQTGALPRSILCGEGIWRWRLYEYKNSGKHDVIDELIRQTVSLLSVKKDDRPFRVFMDKYIMSDNEPVHLYAELRNANAELINIPEASVVITDTSGHKFQYHFEKSNNSYLLNIGLLAPGSYTYKGAVTYNGKAFAAEGSFIVESVPLEQFRTFADFDLMYKLAHQNGGQFFTVANMQSLTDSLSKNELIKPVIHTEKTYVSLIDKRWIFFLILLFASAEWLLRKYWNLV